MSYLAKNKDDEMSQQRKLFVTSALPYANGPIHLGHLVEHIQTDTWVRFQRLMGHECHYICADDAHGTAIMVSAQKANISPEEYIKGIQKDHQKDLKAFHINHDIYYSTHSPENERLAKLFFKAAQNGSAIYQKEITQLYCEESKLFLADRYIKGTCPFCGAEDQYGDSCEKCFATYDPTQLINPISVYSGKAPVLKSSQHYFLKISDYSNVIEKWLDTGVLKPAPRAKIQEWFDQGLKDWDISRDAPYFGIQIPGETDKYFYVWLDAPIGYISTAEKRCESLENISRDDIWKSGQYEIHHFIGKDILYFHALFWPVMLHMAEFQKPSQIHVHGFLTINGEKMSKSRGTFITADHFSNYLNPELLRYYYCSKLSGDIDDIDLNLEDFVFKVNADLVNKFLNIGSRLGKILSKNFENQLSTCDEKGDQMIQKFDASLDDICQLYESLSYNKAMMQIMRLAEMSNKYIQEEEPWSLVKTDPKKAQQVCTSGMNALRRLAILLSPVLPVLSQQVLSLFHQSKCYLPDYKKDLFNTSINEYTHLLKRLSMDDVSILTESNSN